MSQDVVSAALVGLAARGALSVAVVRNGRIVWASPAFHALFGLDPGGALGRPYADLVVLEGAQAVPAVPDETPGVTTALAVAGGLRADGSRFEAEFESVGLELPGGPAAVVSLRDVTDERRAAKRISELAFIDPLTELPNRALFFDRLRQALLDARRHGGTFAVLVGDLDGFKHVNDRYGHETGDALLRIAATRLRAAVRDVDTVARIGGDEFAALLVRASSQDDAEKLAKRMVSSLDSPIVVADRRCEVSFSAGVAMYPADGKDMDELVAHADGAMYAAKRAGGSRFESVRDHRADVTGPLRLPAFVWQDEHAVGVPLIDQGHKQLAVLVNRFSEDLRTGQDAEKLRALLQELTEAARLQFAVVERLLESAGLSGLVGQLKREQHALVDDLEGHLADLGRESAMLTLRYLLAWLTRCIEGNRRYAAALLERDPQAQNRKASRG